MAQAIDATVRGLCGDPDDCRERLLQTAGMLFAARGYEAVSTRELTATAGANLAAIGYYFGGKARLLDAVLDYVADHCRDRVVRIFEQLAADVTVAGDDRDRLAHAGDRCVRHYLRETLPHGPEDWALTMVMKAMSGGPDPEDRLYDNVFAPIWQAVAQFVVAATGRDPDDAKTKVLATATFGEVLTFRRNRVMHQRLLRWTDFTPERIEQVAATAAARMLDRLGLPPVPNG